MSTVSLVLLGTQGCHLCDEAREVILSLAGKIPHDVFEQDIAEKESLVDAFGTRIPVLMEENSGQCLDWPFNAEDVWRWLQQLPAPSL
ncbi:glutaredoxin family protein [Bacterioplanes sanyensis]|uniref:glutaredoxin family protein n=1 Tax=Bacterioplanes sanyensis TaxID=1249553 RepID=UPI0016799D6B|nr:glutaredoxin family protein [Bacterioplanes sanyensis]GGY31689.1 glutaredoxin family protein [Bacterioplanes sanyensis]